LLADLAVVIRHDVVGVGIDPDHAGDRNIDAGLFLDLSDHRVGHGFAHIHGPAGQRPQVVVGLVTNNSSPRSLGTMAVTEGTMLLALGR